MRKRVFSILVISLMAFVLFAVPVSAATTNWFSGSTGTMNSLNGTKGNSFNITSPSINAASAITSITASVSVSNGSDQFYLTLVDPSGYSAQKLIGSSGTVTFTEFANRKAYGTWKTYITTTGLVSTASAKYTFNYQY